MKKHNMPKWRGKRVVHEWDKPGACGGVSVDKSCPDMHCLRCPRYKPKTSRTVIDEQYEINEELKE